MKAFIKYIVNMLSTLIKRSWREFKRDEIKQEVKQLKKESSDAKKESDRAVDDFKSEYELYRLNRDKESDSGSDD
jgi:hypothetical protein